MTTKEASAASELNSVTSRRGESPRPRGGPGVAVGSHFVAGEPVLPAYQLWRTALGIIPSLLEVSPLVATWYALPCSRQSSDDDAPDFPGSGLVSRGNGRPAKPVYRSSIGRTACSDEDLRRLLGWTGPAGRLSRHPPPAARGGARPGDVQRDCSTGAAAVASSARPARASRGGRTGGVEGSRDRPGTDHTDEEKLHG